MPKRKIEVDPIKIIMDVTKNIARISQIQIHFKDILAALVEMTQKQNTDIQVMNEKWKQIKEAVEALNGPIRETNASVNTIVKQLDLKEMKESFGKKLGTARVINNIINTIKEFFKNSKYIAVSLGIIAIIIAWILGKNWVDIKEWIANF